MSGVNKVIIVGRCGKDPETKYLPSGNAVTNISVATSEKWKDKQTGQQQEKTEWHNLVFFNRLAEVAGEYLRKGSMVYIEGKLQTRKWQDQSGNDRYTTEIVANEMQMLGGKQDNQQQQAPAQQPHQQQAPQQMQQAPQQYQQAPPQQMQQQQAPMQQQQPYQQQAPQAGDFDDDISF